jgi:hypothetical protein
LHHQIAISSAGTKSQVTLITLSTYSIASRVQTSSRSGSGVLRSLLWKNLKNSKKVAGPRRLKHGSDTLAGTEMNMPHCDALRCHNLRFR